MINNNNIIAVLNETQRDVSRTVPVVNSIIIHKSDYNCMRGTQILEAFDTLDDRPAGINHYISVVNSIAILSTFNVFEQRVPRRRIILNRI